MDSSSSTQVQGTNDSSIVSKLSMVKFGYMEDPYIEYFVDKYQRRTPLINRGYYLRAKGVTHVVEKFLKGVKGKKQIISLGCGFDTTYFRVQANFPSEEFLFIEIDYKDVIHRKFELSKAFNKFEKMEVDSKFQDIIKLKTKDCCYLSYDLRNVGSVLFNQSLLDCGIEKNIPTLVISEIVLTYLTASQSNRVLRWVDHYFDNALMLVAEQMLPNDGFGRVMYKHFRNLSSPLLSIDNYPTLSSQEERHRKFNFNCLSSITFNEFYTSCLSDDEKQRIKKIELFDEFEGWHQMALHYFFLCSTNSCENNELINICENMFLTSPKSKDNQLTHLLPSTLIEQDIENNLEMFGHSMALCGDQFLIFGGFGIDFFGKQKFHQRLQTFGLFNKKTMEYKPLTTHGKTIPKHLMHSSIVRVKSESKDQDNVYNFIVFGGRTSPKNASNSLYLLTLNTNALSLNINEVFINSNPQPEPRWRHTLTYLSESNSVVVFGGKNNETTFSNSWVFNLGNFTWTELNLPGLKPRHSHSVCCWEELDLLVISGGLNNTMQPYNDVLLVSVKDKTVKSLEIQPSLNPRYSHNSHVVDQNKLLLVGGVKFFSSTNQERDTDICVIDLSRGQWIQTIRFPDRNLLPILLHSHTSYVTNKGSDVTEKDNGSVYDVIIFGGGANLFSFGTNLNKSPIQIKFQINKV